MKLSNSALCFVFCILSFISKGQNPKYEFRAAWVATVENIDWPSKKGLPVDSQKAEFIRLLNMHQRNGLNAVIVQIRPVADAFYPSKLEPWSEYLSGRQGLQPIPYYDPLRFMIEETHKRGMEFHAWCNPYRAVFNTARSSIASSHITLHKKEWFLTYGSDKEGYKKYFDPGIPEARRFVTDVIEDIVKRYDVDAIHFDDYFYPYRVMGREFPDTASYRKYGRGLNRDDWRRSNCDSIILMLNTTIKSIKPHIKFGISPFGVWRNKDKDPTGSDTHAGQTNYDDLYADILLWMKMGWVDYVIPQCYWEIGFTKADYTTLINWWANHSYGRHIYIGHGLYRAGSNTAWRDKSQLPQQIKMLRTYENIYGSAYFSSKNFYRNPNGWSDSLKDNYYKTIALVPPMKWIDSVAPASPIISKSGKNILIKKANENDKIKYFLIYSFAKGIKPDTNNPKSIVKIFSGSDNAILYESFLSANVDKQIGVSVVNQNNNESELVLISQ